MREIHDHFGKNFMLSLVPEGQQTSAAGADYGGQFGSYVPIIEGIRDMLAFTDTQDYNCPPVQGLDGEYYMPGSVDYHAAADGAVPARLLRGAIRSTGSHRCRRSRSSSAT